MNASRFSPRTRWQAVIGTAVVIAAVALVASARPAHTVGGPVPVTVTNGTVPVTESEGAHQAYTLTLIILYANGEPSGTLYGGAQAGIIPSGKRLVVQTISMYRNGAANSSALVVVNTTVNGTTCFYPLPVASDFGATVNGISTPMAIYADGGTSIKATGYRNISTGTETDTVAISGYLISNP